MEYFEWLMDLEIEWNWKTYLILGLVIYWFLSFILFLCPTLIHKKYEPMFKCSNPPFMIAHRGGMMEGTENTLGTLARGFAICPGIEYDVQYTKDNQIVICHDQNLKRLTGIDVNLRETNYIDLPKIQSSYLQHFSTDIYDLDVDDDRRIPLLQDLFKIVPNDIIMNLEFKTVGVEYTERVIEIVREYGMEGQCVWGSLTSPKLNNRLTEAIPRIPRWATGNQSFSFYLKFIFGLLPFLPIYQRLFLFPLHTFGFKQQAEVFKVQEDGGKGKLKMKIATRLIRIFNYFDKYIFWHLRKRGIISQYWTINTPKAYDIALARGVDCIITDCPRALLQYIQKKTI